MSRSRAEFARAAAHENRELRFRRLLGMSYQELRALLLGDPAVAAAWVRSAAEHGLPAAQLRLGRMLLDGTGTLRNEREAYLWFTRAAERGDAAAENMVGRCHENGWGVPVSLVLAAEHYRRSASSGHDWGEYNFGNMLFEGRGIAADPPRALHFYLRAARQGHARAMNLIARCLEEGWGCRSSLTDALYWYRRSAEGGYFRGQFNYASMLLERGRSTLAAEWFWKAALAGNEDTRRSISMVLERAMHPVLRALAARVRQLEEPTGGPGSGAV
ncbi:MAG TPA: tetratricopeptide repeat protein [Steroidobacteraceae bacterium]|jgi:uncharacterized protein|nr:tetratricopeptide repeat protein [Steroidobacteraceae bacterium]